MRLISARSAVRACLSLITIMHKKIKQFLSKLKAYFALKLNTITDYIFDKCTELVLYLTQQVVKLNSYCKETSQLCFLRLKKNLILFFEPKKEYTIQTLNSIYTAIYSYLTLFPNFCKRIFGRTRVAKKLGLVTYSRVTLQKAINGVDVNNPLTSSNKLVKAVVEYSIIVCFIICFFSDEDY